jgi:hypothetical protein
LWNACYPAEPWSPSTPLRVAADRRQALIDIDALVAIALGITADELCTIYRTQFPVMAGYDRTSYVYDANGRLVPNSVQVAWRKAGGKPGIVDAEIDMPRESRTAVHPGSGIAYEYVLPFTTLDREADLRAAYTHFGNLLADK